MTGPRGELLERIARILEGDWSATVFDGKDSAKWVRTAARGSEEDLTLLAQELEEVENWYR